MQQMIWRWKAWTNAKLFGMYCFSHFFTVLSQFRKWRKMYFCRNFYKLYRNGANNIPLKSYGKCETFSCWWFSLIPSRFQVISKMARSCVLPLSRNIFFECTAWRTWTSRRVYLNFTLFSLVFFARSSPSTRRNWASDIPMERCCKHTTFPCWSFFHTRNGFKRFSSQIHSV